MPYYSSLAVNVSQIIQSAVVVGKHLQELTEQANTPGAVLDRLSTEVFLIESALRKLPEYAWKPKKVTQLRDPKIASDLDEVLLAIAVILLEMPAQLTTIVKKHTKKFPWKLKDDSNGLLSRLRARHSALRLLLTIISMLPGDETRKRVEANAAALEVIRNERMESLKQLAMKNQSHPYISKLLDDPDGSFEAAKLPKRKGRPPRLTSELIRYGLSPEDVRKVYDEGGLKSWVVTDMLQDIKSYGSEEDYRTALAFLMRNHSIAFVMDSLGAFIAFGPEYYSLQLRLLRSNSYDFYAIHQRFMGLTTFSLGCGKFVDLQKQIYQDRLPSITSPDITHIQRRNLVCIFGALQARGDSFAAVYADIRALLQVPHGYAELDYSQDQNAVRATIFCSNVLMRFWERKAFAPIASVKRTIDKISNSTESMGDRRLYLVKTCLLLHRFSFQPDLILEALQQMPRGDKPEFYLHKNVLATRAHDAHTLLAYGSRSLDNQTLLAAIVRLSSKLSRMPMLLLNLACRNNFDFTRILEIERRLVDASSRRIVETDQCWELLEANKFDLNLTLEDIAGIPSCNGRAIGSSSVKRVIKARKGAMENHPGQGYKYTPMTIQDEDVIWEISPPEFWLVQ